ncbi:hypothetical protein COLO4_11279 [Corchorus olitorius]|uniref:Uncharacterized protein n=1 Tax=Corchorus olitorius TaxID=93759 RepID=A0A1R3K541_9ROSI|nr:hypothetical protein COLO4_11279 [Corchorus olitorius]
MCLLLMKVEGNNPLGFRTHKIKQKSFPNYNLMSQLWDQRDDDDEGANGGGDGGFNLVIEIGGLDELCSRIL